MDLYINILELKAAKLAIVSFHEYLTAMFIYIQMNNILALSKQNRGYTILTARGQGAFQSAWNK